MEEQNKSKHIERESDERKRIALDDAIFDGRIAGIVSGLCFATIQSGELVYRLISGDNSSLLANTIYRPIIGFSLPLAIGTVTGIIQYYRELKGGNYKNERK